MCSASRDSHGDTLPRCLAGIEPGSFHQVLTRSALILRDKLPGYMIPRHFVLLDQLPLNSSGKVDVPALAGTETGTAQSQQYVAPQNPVEQTLVDIWSRVLEVEHVGTHDNFFDLGGSSLTSLRIVAMLNESGLQLEGEQIKPELLFEYPTVAELAAFWESYSSSPTATRMRPL